MYTIISRLSFESDKKVMHFHQMLNEKKSLHLILYSGKGAWT